MGKHTLFNLDRVVVGITNPVSSRSKDGLAEIHIPVSSQTWAGGYNNLCFIMRGTMGINNPCFI